MLDEDKLFEQDVVEIMSRSSNAWRALRSTQIDSDVGKAKQAADEAKERAEESIEEAAGKLGYIDFQELLQQDKLSGELPGVYISNVAAESILAGDITASLINISGRLQAGRTVLDSTGLHLRSIISAVNRPSEDVHYKITPYENNQSAFWFYEDNNERGVTIRTDGDSGGLNGRLEFAATRAGDLDAVTSARLRLNSSRSGGGVVNVKPDLWVERDATINRYLNVNNDIYASGQVTGHSRVGPSPQGTYARQLYLPPTTLANGQTVNLPHGFGEPPDFIHAQAAYANWVTLSGNGNNWDVTASSNRVSITNRSGASRGVRASIMNGG